MLLLLAAVLLGSCADAGHVALSGTLCCCEFGSETHGAMDGDEIGKGREGKEGTTDKALAIYNYGIHRFVIPQITVNG